MQPLKNTNYQLYVKEREGVDVLEFDHGFIKFQLFQQSLVIYDIFVRKDQRKSGLGAKMVQLAIETVGKDAVKYLLAQVDSKALQATESLKINLNYGFMISKIENGIIYLYKEL